MMFIISLWYFFIINNDNIYNFIVQWYQYMDTAHLNY